MSGENRGSEEGFGVCVLGRVDFGTGIGKHTAAALELLGRGMDVSLYPTRTQASELGASIQLPSGRIIPVVDRLEGFAAYWFADVLWNGAGDLNYTAMPRSGHRIAYLAFDSDELPEEWVKILNERFDLVLFTSSFPRRGVQALRPRHPGRRPALALTSRSSPPADARPSKRPVRFGTISAFHDRKNLEVLIEAFASCFGLEEPVELVIHSNLAFGRTFDRISALVAALPGDRIKLSTDHRSDEAVQDLMASFDVYVNVAAGEGYSIGPREAWLSGRRWSSATSPHTATSPDCPASSWSSRPVGSPLATPSSTTWSSAARRRSTAPRSPPACAWPWTSSRAPSCSRAPRHAVPGRSSSPRPCSRPTTDGRSIRTRRGAEPSPVAPTTASSPARDRLGTAAPPAPRGEARTPQARMLPAHDGGFFSLFNSFLSHLSWSMQESSPPMVLPDWDAGRLIERFAPDPIVSYCYSKPGDGNLWLALFEPLYGLSDAEMDDPELLYEGREISDIHNAHYEPLLTFTHAYDLYRAPWFARFRRQYHDVLAEHVQLRPAYQAEIDAMKAQLAGRFTVSVHIKHPSHAIEQPGERIAGRDEYLAAVRQVLRAIGASTSGATSGASSSPPTRTASPPAFVRPSASTSSPSMT